ncbi:MAG: hypothetical protein OXE94_14115 [Aestuariivita sp.]|nr:hypothetical protein [Aestuariivita sp.]MCY4202305.1 hypothetical protein [Aestuariivita sp.]MCY4289915.1 hypothetical protein [Aestuariivita sp.]MCY4346750.1 hypothetical protein [Aestuariivita sp.]
MTEERDNAMAIAKLEGEVKALEERMETKQAEYRTDISHLAEKMAERDKEAAQRETRLILAIAVIVGVGLAIFGFLTAPPSP